MLPRKPRRRKRPDTTKGMAFPKRLYDLAVDDARGWLAGGHPPRHPYDLERDAFLGWVRGQRCIVGEMSSDPCCEGTQAAHPNEGKGVGMKTDDMGCIPLCPIHHQLMDNGAPRMQLLKRLVFRLASQLVRVRYSRLSEYKPVGTPW